MTALDVLVELSRLGVRLEAGTGGRLRYSPRHVVPRSLAEHMRAYKAQLLAHLRTWGDCWHVEWTDEIYIDELEPCPTCGTLELWETLASTWRCQHCDSDAFQRSFELADRAARLRRGERLPPLRRQRKTKPARASPTKVVKRDAVKRASPENQGTLFDGVSSKPTLKKEDVAFVKERN